MTPAPPKPFVFRPSARVLETIDEMYGPLPKLPSQRTPRCTQLRCLRVKALRELCGCSYPRIAELLGFLSHTGPMYLLKHKLYREDEYGRIKERILRELPEWTRNMSPAPTYPEILRPINRVLQICEDICGPMADAPNWTASDCALRGVRIRALRELCGCSYQRIAKLLGYRSHQSCIDALKKGRWSQEKYFEVERRVQAEVPLNEVAYGSRAEADRIVHGACATEVLA